MLPRTLVRNFMTSAIRRSGNDNHGGIPGANLPFDIHNRYKLTAYFILYCGSAIGIPYLIVRHQLLKM